MIPVSSLLNATPPASRIGNLPASPSPSDYTASSHGSPVPFYHHMKKQKMTKDGPLFAKGQIKGMVNFRPYDMLDERAQEQVNKFRVSPLRHIHEYPRHIPYNSEKKTFLEKTGRESFEVFQYVFMLPGEEKEYLVLWDYNIGLVRITPFFKCCKYSKTTPAKMLNLNPGLKEITHSITGGALAAQGYWMPYSCALAVCATFCDHISGALIPIFGPDFPGKCVSISSPLYGRMVIDASIIEEATQEANLFRQHYSTTCFGSYPTPSSFRLGSSSPSDRHRRDLSTTPAHGTPMHLSRRLQLKRSCGQDPLYCSDTDTSETGSMGEHYISSPGTPSLPAAYTSSTASIGGHDFNAINSINSEEILRAENMRGTGRSRTAKHKNALSCGTSPWLSAIPRSINEGHDKRYVQGNGVKRCATEVSRDTGYDEEEGGSADVRENEHDITEKNAARLLMKLSVRDAHRDPEIGKDTMTLALGNRCSDSLDRPRIKRRRATSC